MSYNKLKNDHGAYHWSSTFVPNTRASVSRVQKSTPAATHGHQGLLGRESARFVASEERGAVLTGRTPADGQGLTAFFASVCRQGRRAAAEAQTTRFHVEGTAGDARALGGHQQQFPVHFKVLR